MIDWSLTFTCPIHGSDLMDFDLYGDARHGLDTFCRGKIQKKFLWFRWEVSCKFEHTIPYPIPMNRIRGERK